MNLTSRFATATVNLESEFYAPLVHPLVIELIGKDANKVMNNLCTNDVSKLSVGGSCETFVTDLRGWVVAHGIALQQDNGMVLIGQHRNPSQVCEHIDRYIISEDATIANLSETKSLFAMSSNPELSVFEADERFARADAICVAANICSDHSAILCASSDSNGLGDALSSLGFNAAPEVQAEYARIRVAWPEQGKEIVEKSLPQELNRDSVAISFTKGCYLGQETIARLDARGQVQRKLCVLEVSGTSAGVGDSLTNGEKEVGKISSIAANPDALGMFALATVRRGSFSIGTELQCGDSKAVVVRPIVKSED